MMCFHKGPLVNLGYREHSMLVGWSVGLSVEWCKLSFYANEPCDEEVVYFERWYRWSTILVTFWFCHITCSALRMSLELLKPVCPEKPFQTKVRI